MASAGCDFRVALERVRWEFGSGLLDGAGWLVGLGAEGERE